MPHMSIQPIPLSTRHGRATLHEMPPLLYIPINKTIPRERETVDTAVSHVTHKKNAAR
jgi:hypothetical protein